MKNICARCRIDYPESIPLNPLIGNAKWVGKLLCGQCALEIINNETGIQRKQFQGEMAEHYRQLALEYRKRIGK